MNLLHLHKTCDPILVMGAEVRPLRTTVLDRTYDGFVIPGGGRGAVRLKSALRWHPFALRSAATDWLAVAKSKEGVEIEVSLVDAQGVTVARVVDRVGAGPSVVSLPRLSGPTRIEDDRALDLVIRNRGVDRAPILLLVAEVDDAAPFLTLARGMGVELLSDGAMLLAPGSDRELFPVGTKEQIAAHAANDSQLRDGWYQALIGQSHDIPLVDGELDFIFAANILHRAVNPLGHLKRWRARLNEGGRVLGIVPYLGAGSDYLNAPTAMTDWLGHYATGGFVETQAHHDAFGHARGINPKSLFRRRHPSSFSFFTPANVAEMMIFAVEELGFAGFHIEHARNGRDIRFGLYC